MVEAKLRQPTRRLETRIVTIIYDAESAWSPTLALARWAMIAVNNDKGPVNIGAPLTNTLSRCDAWTKRVIGPLHMLPRKNMVVPEALIVKDVKNLTKAQERKQYLSGVPLYTQLLNSLSKGAFFGDCPKLLVFDLTPYDGLLQQTAADHYARPIEHVPPFALITCLWREIILGENRTKIRGFVNRTLKNHIVDLWKRKLVELPGVARSQPPTHDERPLLRKQKYKVMYPMDEQTLAVPQSMLDAWKDTNIKDELDEII